MNISSSFSFIEDFLGQTPVEMMTMSSSEASLDGGGFVSLSKQQKNINGDSENTGNVTQAVSSLWMIFYFTMLNFMYQICLRHLRQWIEFSSLHWGQKQWSVISKRPISEHVFSWLKFGSILCHIFVISYYKWFSHLTYFA